MEQTSSRTEGERTAISREGDRQRGSILAEVTDLLSPGSIGEEENGLPS
jgi:hypothetical protein